MTTASRSTFSRDDARAWDAIEQHGRTAVAFQAINPGLCHWFDGARGLVAYADTGRAWVAAGEPVASPDDAVELAEHFVLAARRERRRAAFFATCGRRDRCTAYDHAGGVVERVTRALVAGSQLGAVRLCRPRAHSPRPVGRSSPLATVA